MRHSRLLSRAALLTSVSLLSSLAYAAAPTTPPDPPAFSGQGKITFVDRGAIEEYKALPSYSEPDWVTEQFVKTGKLPPVKDRLPKEPLVYKTGNMADGVGVYGDTMRHVIGGRPEGWNYTAGQSQGWGGLDIALSECLTRTAPLFQVKAEDLEPLPNLAKGWEWSADGHTLTMHLIEGAKWSDGEPFTADDPMFYWQILHDTNISPLNGATLATFGEGTTLEAKDPYTLVWTFKDAFPKQYLFNMAYGTFCPGPAHLLKPLYPKTSGKTYEEYKNAFPPTYMNFPTMGAWVPVAYRENDIIVLRRNPYYWKVDEAGHQLPYLNEMHYKLSTWADRDVQAVAGSGDFSNLEQPESFVEVAEARRASRRAGAARIRTAHHRLFAVHQHVGQRLGRAGRTFGRRCACWPATSISAKPSRWRSTGRNSASRSSRDLSRPSIPADCSAARATMTSPQRSTTPMTSPKRRRNSRKPASSMPTAKAA